MHQDRRYLGAFADGPDVDVNMRLILARNKYLVLTGSLNASEGFIGNLTSKLDTATNTGTASDNANFSAYYSKLL